jgi:hypothetical protein
MNPLRLTSVQAFQTFSNTQYSIDISNLDHCNTGKLPAILIIFHTKATGVILRMVTVTAKEPFCGEWDYKCENEVHAW